MTNHEAMRQILQSARERKGLWLGHNFIPLDVLERAATEFLAHEQEVILNSTSGPLTPIGILGDLLK